MVQPTFGGNGLINEDITKALEIFKNMEPEDQELAMHVIENVLLHKYKENEAIMKMIGYKK